MRYFLYFCVSTLLLVGFAGKLGNLFQVKPAAMATQASPAPGKAAQQPPARKGSGIAYVRLDRRNQFTTAIEIDGKPFQGIIDTGANIVAIRYEDAQALGLFRNGERWNSVVSTANGTGRGMQVFLNNLAIGDLIVYDVEALVLSKGAVSTNLIGMSLLRRLSKFEVRPDMIVLER